MSGNQTKNFPDGKHMTSEEDKCGACDSATDSGFISGDISEEFSSSRELKSEEFKLPTPPQSETDLKKSTITPIEVDSGILDDAMRLNSDCCRLEEDLSNLKISSGLNDLSGISPTTPVESTIIEPEDKPCTTKLYYGQNEDGDTYLHLTIRQGLAELTRALIQVAFHPMLLDTSNDDAQTPLHLAVESGQYLVARWLRAAGAKPCPRDLNGDSPLHLAARNGDLNCIKAIVEPVNRQETDSLALRYQVPPYQGCELDQWNYVGQTCVHVAAMHGHLDVLKHLVYRGADINAREGLEGLTALHYAALRRDEEMVLYLLNECKTLNAQITTYGGRNAYQINPIVPMVIESALRRQGLSSPYSSDEEFDSDSSDDEINFDKSRHNFLQQNMVGTSA